MSTTSLPVYKISTTNKKPPTRAVRMGKGRLSDGVSRLSDGASNQPKPSDPHLETISIRPQGASSALGSRSPVSRQQSRNGAGQEKVTSKGRSFAKSRGETQGQLAECPSQPQGCPDDLRGNSKVGGGANHRQPLRVFVLAKNGQPLMPCRPSKARKLLASGEAVVARVLPFTIRLKKETSRNLQPIELKLDPGSVHTGIAVVTESSNLRVSPLFLAELQHRGSQIKSNLMTRAACRRRRRNANLRYRPARFNNRTKPEGWLAPSLRHRLETTQAWLTRLRSLAPITRLAQELVRFDLQKMVNPEVSGVEYQQGTLQGYEVREYLLAKWDRKCAYCGAENVPLQIEHVVAKARGGTNRVTNLTLACRPCNERKGTRSIEEFLKKDPTRLRKVLGNLKAPLKDATAVNATRWALWQMLKSTGLPVRTGSGGQTKWNRTRLGIPKSHAFDALCVSSVEGVSRWNMPVLKIKSMGRGSRQLAMLDAYGFPRTAKGASRPRTKGLKTKAGELRSPVVIAKGECYKVRGQTQREKGLSLKRPYGLATGDFVRFEGRVSRVVSAKGSGSIILQAHKKDGTITTRSVTWRKLTLVVRSSGYDMTIERPL